MGQWIASIDETICMHFSIQDCLQLIVDNQLPIFGADQNWLFLAAAATISTATVAASHFSNKVEVLSLMIVHHFTLYFFTAAGQRVDHGLLQIVAAKAVHLQCHAAATATVVDMLWKLDLSWAASSNFM